mmetsp:Transcript_27350/g.53059  ORF Transcript_27350/g.53059 Transcript_27350/m.53059 type:complete len:217 (-) Transcript_27350:110-760(-)
MSVMSVWWMRYVAVMLACHLTLLQLPPVHAFPSDYGRKYGCSSPPEIGTIYMGSPSEEKNLMTFRLQTAGVDEEKGEKKKGEANADKKSATSNNIFSFEHGRRYTITIEDERKAHYLVDVSKGALSVSDDNKYRGSVSCDGLRFVSTGSKSSIVFDWEPAPNSPTSSSSPEGSSVEFTVARAYGYGSVKIAKVSLKSTADIEAIKKKEERLLDDEL